MGAGSGRSCSVADNSGDPYDSDDENVPFKGAGGQSADGMDADRDSDVGQGFSQLLAMAGGGGGGGSGGPKPDAFPRRLIVTLGDSVAQKAALEPAWDPDVVKYKLVVPFDVSSVAVTPADFSVAHPKVVVQRRDAQGRIMDAEQELYDELQPWYGEMQELREELKRKKEEEARGRRNNNGVFDMPPELLREMEMETGFEDQLDALEGSGENDESRRQQELEELEAKKQALVEAHDRVISFRFEDLHVGKNVIKVHVSLRHANARLYTFQVFREDWTRDGWAPGSSRDRFRWYLAGAMYGNPIAQYYLALMYAGDEMEIVEWEKAHGKKREEEEKRRMLARRKSKGNLLLLDLLEANEEQQKQQGDGGADGDGDGDGEYGYRGGEAGGERNPRDQDQDEFRDDFMEKDFFGSSGMSGRGGNGADGEEDEEITTGFNGNEEDWAVEWAEDWLDSSEVSEALKQQKESRNREEFLRQAQHLHYKWLMASARQGYIEAMYRMANLYLSGGVPNDIVEEERSIHPDAQKHARYADDAFTKQIAAAWFEKTAEMGDIRAAYQLAQMYVDGVGVPMDFERALYWFVERAGVPEEIAQQAIRKKFASLKPKYQRLFDSHDADGDGKIDKKQFQTFYRDVWRATGMSMRQATQVSQAAYNGKRKSDVLFQAYDADKDYKITFEEIWSHPHTHTSLVPKNEHQLVRSEAFFHRWLQHAGGGASGDGGGGGDRDS